MEQPDAAALEKEIAPRRFLIIACDETNQLQIEECDFTSWELDGIAAWLRLSAERAPRRFLIIACDETNQLQIEECDFTSWELDGIAAWLRLSAERDLMEDIDEGVGDP